MNWYSGAEIYMPEGPDVKGLAIHEEKVWLGDEPCDKDSAPDGEEAEDDAKGDV
jgi:hypothetical protein